MYFTYAIGNEKTRQIYIGQTSHLENRLKRHNGLLKQKRKGFTYKNKGEWILIYKEDFSTRQSAIKREKELKSFKGREFIRSIWNNMRP